MRHLEANLSSPKVSQKNRLRLKGMALEFI